MEPDTDQLSILTAADTINAACRERARRILEAALAEVMEVPANKFGIPDADGYVQSGASCAAERALDAARVKLGYAPR